MQAGKVSALLHLLAASKRCQSFSAWSALKALENARPRRHIDMSPFVEPDPSLTGDNHQEAIRGQP